MSGAIDPNIKLAIEAQTRAFVTELDKRFAAQEAKWESRVSALEAAMVAPSPEAVEALKNEIDGALGSQLAGLEAFVTERLLQVEAAALTQVAALESAAAAFEAWRPYIESVVDGVRSEVVNMNKALDREMKTSILGEFGSASAHPPGGAPADGPHGHRVEFSHRETGPGRMSSQHHLPHNGVYETS
ncbi:hypothetical protein PR202_gb16213 [Eleusine coracana subsp. coracana]|uniref:Uncharacterized protein n=1 Tax=Eleusine coracana subsp. coracana TaxID=191504 RepID=A0AAV5EZV3_ELECO|nr:hypothetical protein PR202_gb16213 [Eleusine coracana subsp. coracana]